MRLLRSRRPVTADTPLEGAQEMRPRRVSDLSASEVQASIDRALRIFEARRAAGGRRELELQVVVQACPAGLHYARWRKERNRVMARSSKRWGTGAWPEQLPSGHVAIVVLPYAAGRVGPALAAAKVVYMPAFIDGRAETRAAIELLAMQAVRRVAAHDRRRGHARARAAGARGVPAGTCAAPLAAGLRRVVVAAAAARRPVAHRSQVGARHPS